MELGVSAKDKVTGQTGTVTARVEYAYGNPRLCLEWASHDGKTIHEEWFPEDRLELVG
jgi:hypothetical protein